MKARMLYIHALSPVHSGTGQSTDVVDLPVARERITEWPYLPGTSIKGVLRDACDPGNASNRSQFIAAFGGADDGQDLNAGSLCFTDAHLLCLPVRSYYGSFAWITCPLALKRWIRDHLASNQTIGLKEQAIPIPEAQSDNEFIVLPQLNQPLKNEIAYSTQQMRMVYLEDFDLVGSVNPVATTIATTIAQSVFADETWQNHFIQRFGIVGDDLFSFMARTATEVAARVVLKATAKTADNFWYEEAVPAESIFAGPLLAMTRPDQNGQADPFTLLAKPLQQMLQIGGNASVGRGLVQMRMVTPQAVPSGNSPAQAQVQQNQRRI